MNKVAVVKTRNYYPQDLMMTDTHIHDALLRGFNLLGCDEKNPFGDIINPGDRVFVKPNFVTDKYRESCPLDEDIYSVITHPSIIKAVVDFAAKALQGSGEIIIGDCPTIDADFDNLMFITGLRELQDKYEVPIYIYDLRNEWCDDLKNYGFKSKMKKLTGDSEGSSIINLGHKSLFKDDNPLLFRGIYSKRWDTIKHHLFGKHKYSISNTMLNSDVFISIPKLKTHRKVGATLNIKGLVGINTNKNFLIHWKVGSPSLGGDEWYNPKNFYEYFLMITRHLLNDFLPESIYLKLRKAFPNLFTTEVSPCGEKHRGSGIKNETCWRMASDLYEAFVNSRREDVKFFSIIDGIMSGEGNGPFCPKARNDGVIVMGRDFVQTDCVAVKLMGFNPHKIKYLRHYLNGEYNIDTGYYPEKFQLDFEAPTGWENLKGGQDEKI